MAAETQPAGGAQGTAAPPATPQGTGAPAPEGQGKGGMTGDQAAELLKENMAMKKQLAKLTEDNKAAEDAKLKENGKFKELHEKATTEGQALRQRLIQQELRMQAVLAGISDPDFCMLLKTDGVTIDANHNVTGAAEAVAALKAAKPMLFGSGAVPVPGVPAPGGATTATGFKTWEEYSKAPEAERSAWAAKFPQAFQALAKTAMGIK